RDGVYVHSCPVVWIASVSIRIRQFLPLKQPEDVYMKLRLFFKRLMRHLMCIGTPLSGLLLALMLPVSSQAQVLYGSIVGNVTDKSGAVITDATVRIANKGTNQTRETLTNVDGSFSFPTVQTGTWEITVSKNGFKSTTRTNIDVTLNNITRYDFS